MNKNPKGLYGIDIPEKIEYAKKLTGSMPIYIYHYCTFCHNKWETTEQWANQPIKHIHDYCSECYKNS